MRHPLLKTILLVIFININLTVNAQENDANILVTVPAQEKDDDKTSAIDEKPTIATKKSNAYFRHHKKLSATFEGYIIELTTSDFPLNRDYHLFEQFGEVYYEKLKGQGYSYLIVANFSSKKSIEQYVQNVVLYKAPEAKVVEYRKGKRVEDKNKKS